jgi:hypothetical protein
MEPGIPGLVGLRSSYIVAQLTRWRTGNRQAPQPDCMKRIAEPSVGSGRACRRHLALHTGRAARRISASSNLQKMPLACGSQM